jgi:hypothetical protein
MYPWYFEFPAQIHQDDFNAREDFINFSDPNGQNALLTKPGWNLVADGDDAAPTLQM